MIIKNSVVYNRMFLMVLSSDHITGATGKTVTVALSKSGASFGTAVGAVTEVTGGSNGFYYITLSAADTNVLGDLAFHCTASGCDPTDFVDQVQTQIFTDLSLNPSGQALAASNIKQNVALNGFTFVMTLATTHAPATGLTVTAQRSLAGAGFSPCANAVSEVSNGIYSINLATTDTNASTVMLRFTAPTADDLNILLITQP